MERGSVGARERGNKAEQGAGTWDDEFAEKRASWGNGFRGRGRREKNASVAYRSLLKVVNERMQRQDFPGQSQASRGAEVGSGADGERARAQRNAT